MAKSTYQQFKNWYDKGLGTGDLVIFGRYVYMIKDSLPGRTTLMAYLNSNGKVVEEEKEVRVEDLTIPDESLQTAFLEALENQELIVNQKSARFDMVYSPEKFTYASYINEKGKLCVGIYRASDVHKYNFLAVVCGNEILTNHSVQRKNIFIAPSSPKEIGIFEKKLLNAGWVFNTHKNALEEVPVIGNNNVYWYLTDRFSVAADKDNGAVKHRVRYRVGNYFLNYDEAVLFMKEVIDMRKK